MNCKPGDLVVVIRSEIGNEGRIGRVVARAVAPAGFGKGYTIFPDDDWIVQGRFATADEHVMSMFGKEVARWDDNFCEVDELPFPDAYLRPIRDRDGTDETLTWAGKPQLVEA